jgi:hypothetical protein
MMMMMMMMMRNPCTWLTTQKKQLTWKRDYLLLRLFPVNLEQLTVYNKPNGPSVYLSKWFSDLLSYLTKKMGKR